MDSTPPSHNIMLSGKHGIGKSKIITDHFSAKGQKVVTLFLGQMSDPGDLIGLPNKDEKTGKTVFMPPYWFPTDNQPVVLFLDELNRARPEILQTIMDLALNRKGSDFIRMAAILQETEKNKPGMADIFCNWSRLKDKSPLSSDAELECSNDMDDGSTWAEGPLRNPKLEHIIVCHALHALCTHMNWSIPDVLRINDLSIEVKLTIQQFSDQERNRLDWCSNYDLQHFKEVLLKEAADRPEGVSLENALLQRCRDYFEDIADEILDKVGLSDIDLYLETLKNRIDKS